MNMQLFDSYLTFETLIKLASLIFGIFVFGAALYPRIYKMIDDRIEKVKDTFYPRVADMIDEKIEKTKSSVYPLVSGVGLENRVEKVETNFQMLYKIEGMVEHMTNRLQSISEHMENRLEKISDRIDKFVENGNGTS